MLRNIKLIGEERSYPSKLHDALPSVHDRNLVLAHQLYATLSSDEFNFAHKKSRDSLESLLVLTTVFSYMAESNDKNNIKTLF